MALKDRSSFSAQQLAAPSVAPALQALQNVGGLITDEQKLMANEQLRQDTLAQRALENQRANALLGIQQAKEGRAVSEFDRLTAQRQALQESASMPANITSGEAGQQRFEKAANIIGTVPEYDTAIAQLDPNAPDYNAKVDALRAQVASNAARDAALERLGTGYAAVSQASGYDGLKHSKADPEYEGRVYRDLIAKGVPVKAAKEQASTLASAFEPKPLTKEQAKLRDNELKRVDTTLKNKLDITKNLNERAKASGGIKKDGFGKSKIDKTIKDLGFTDGMFSGGNTPANVTQMANQLRVKYAKEGITESDIADALYMKTKGEAGAWLSLDPRVAEAELLKEAIKISGSRKAASTGGNYDSKLYSKYGPDYIDQANAALASADAQRAAIMAKYTPSSRNTTGLDVLEKSYNRFDTPTSGVTAPAPVATSRQNVAPSVSAVPPVVGGSNVIRPGTPEYAAQLEAIRKASGDTVIPPKAPIGTRVVESLNQVAPALQRALLLESTGKSTALDRFKEVFGNDNSKKDITKLEKAAAEGKRNAIAELKKSQPDSVAGMPDEQIALLIDSLLDNAPNLRSPAILRNQ